MHFVWFLYPTGGILFFHGYYDFLMFDCDNRWHISDIACKYEFFLSNPTGGIALQRFFHVVNCNLILFEHNLRKFSCDGLLSPVWSRFHHSFITVHRLRPICNLVLQPGFVTQLQLSPFNLKFFKTCSVYLWCEWCELYNIYRYIFENRNYSSINHVDYKT